MTAPVQPQPQPPDARRALLMQLLQAMGYGRQPADMTRAIHPQGAGFMDEFLYQMHRKHDLEMQNDSTDATLKRYNIPRRA